MADLVDRSVVLDRCDRQVKHYETRFAEAIERLRANPCYFDALDCLSVLTAAIVSREANASLRRFVTRIPAGTAEAADGDNSAVKERP